MKKIEKEKRYFVMGDNEEWKKETMG